MRLAAFLAILVPLALFGCGEGNDGTFAQHPGFARHFAEYPRATEPANATDQVLLQRYRPRLFVGADAEGPISFYRDYIAAGTLTTGAGRRIEDVDQAALNRYRNDPGAVFVHSARHAAPVPTPTVFARAERFARPGFLVLTYHFTFRQSGLLAGLPWWKEWPLTALFDGDDWHQLDHYTAVRVVLYDQVPIMIWMQQHNFMRTYVIGDGVVLPSDDRIMISAAERSNELYPHEPGRVRHRAISFPETEQFEFLLAGGDPPLMAGHDITDPAREVDYDLAFPSPDDAFYSFQGWLGEKRFHWSRSGPPGADYNAMPFMKGTLREVAAGYWRPDNAEDLVRLRSTMDSEGNVAFEHWLALNSARLFTAAPCLARGERISNFC